MKVTNNELYFLSGGGEMGELLRAKDWSKTPLGDPATWPQSLRTMVAVMLDNPFGMYIAWGEDYIQLYNDGYRPILGSTKHPQALGISTKETFSEIWHIIGSMFDGVMQGKAVGFPDFMLPLNRNGFVEECYFDFSYSPIRKENGEVGGILVTVIETTEKKKATEALKASNQRFFDNMMHAPVAMSVFRGPNHIVEVANEKMFEMWGKRPEEMMNKPIFEGLPEAKNQGLEALIDNVFITGEKFVANERLVVLPRNGKIENIYVNFIYEPLKEADGTISGIVAIATEVTSQGLSRSKLEENEERLNIVVEASELGTWEWNVKTKEVKYSKRYLEIIGGYQEEIALTHEQLKKHIHPDDMPIREKALNDAFANGHLHYEARMIWTDNSIHWMEGKGKVFYDEDGNPEKLIGTIRDITPDKKYQQELEESEKKFRLLADAMPQHIWTSDPQGNLNYFNKSVYDYSGLTHEQLDASSWIEIVHPDDREENIRIWLEAIATGNDFLFEHRFRRHDGTYRWQLSRAIPQLDENGKIQMWVGSSTDIQEQKIFTEELEKLVTERTKELVETNETLIKSEARYHLMVEEVQDYAILYLNQDGIVENWNLGAEKIKGYAANEIIGKSFSTFYTESDRKSNLPQTLLKQAMQTGKAKQEGWRVRKDGSLFWANVVITAVHNDKKEVIGFSKVTHDLSEKKQAEDLLKLNGLALEEKNAELQKMNKELQSFAYISSHDLQEPLRKIQAFSTLIMEKESQYLSSSGKDIFRRMQNAAQRMQVLINDLLAYSRSNIQERKFEKTNLKAIIEEVKGDMEEELQQKNAAIESDGSYEIFVIPFQFRQLIYNLVSNSLKFAKADVPPVIKINGSIAKAEAFNNNKLINGITYCHISISDNGIGFEQQYSKKIFEVFQRLHGRDEYVGTGIGLAIVKRIVDNHNGYITANGEKDKGATFDIYLPIDATVNQ